MALAILTLVILTTLAVFTERTRRVKHANEMMLAWQVLANEADLWRHTSFGSIQPATPPDVFSTDTTLLKALKPFKTRVDVVEVRPSMKEVTLTITWKAGKRNASLVLIRTSTGGSNLW